MMRVDKNSIIRFSGRDGKFVVFQHRCHEKKHLIATSPQGQFQPDASTTKPVV
jgi:hypothetical protein